MIILASPSGIAIPQSQVTGLPAALAAKADDASVVHKAGSIAETITGAKTLTATATLSVSSSTLATIVRMVNPDGTVTNGSYSWSIGGPGNFNGELQLNRDTIGLLARFNTSGITLPSGKSYSVDTGGGLVYLQNGNNSVDFDTSGLNLRGLTRIVQRIAGVVISTITATLTYFSTKLVTGATSLGSAGAQLESRSPDASTPIIAGYSYLGTVAFQVGPTGVTSLSELRIGTNALVVRQHATLPAVEFASACIFSNVAGFGVTTSSTIRLRIAGTGTTSATTSLQVMDSGGNPTLVCLDDRRVLVGSNTAGSAAAQLEAKAKDAGTPIHAGYTSGGTAAYIFRSDGSLKLPQLADSVAVNDSIYYSTTAGKLAYKDPSGVVTPLY